MMANGLARQLAYKNSEFTIKSNDISLAHLRSDLSLRNSKIMEKIRYDHDLEILEKEIEGGKYDRSTSSGTKTDAGKDVNVTKDQIDKKIKRDGVVDSDATEVETKTKATGDSTKTVTPAEKVKIKKSSDTGIPDERDDVDKEYIDPFTYRDK